MLRGPERPGSLGEIPEGQRGVKPCQNPEGIGSLTPVMGALEELRWDLVKVGLYLTADNNLRESRSHLTNLSSSIFNDMQNRLVMISTEVW